MRRFLLLFLLSIQSGWAENLPGPFSLGFSFSSYESRFFRKSQETVWTRAEFCIRDSKIIIPNGDCLRNGLFWEKRGETPLLSYLFENSKFYFSYGNRFRPLRHFFFLRETFDFSSFWFLEQPIVRSSFAGWKFGQSILGAYYAEKGARKTPGFFLKPFGNYLELAYSPETKEGFLLLEYPSQEEQRSEKKRFGFRIEAFGPKENIQGIFSAHWKEPELFRRIFLTGYRGRSGQLFNLADSPGSEETATLLRLVWEPGLYSKLQFAESLRNSEEGQLLYSARSFSGRTDLLRLPVVAVLVQARAYRFSDSPAWLWGKGLFLAYQKRFWKWEIGQEWRTNGDKITEAGFQISIHEDWKIYSSILYAEEGNRMPAFAEESITPEETGLVVTDKTFYSFLRIFHPYFAIHLRHSREKEGKGDGLSARFQVFFPLGD